MARTEETSCGLAVFIANLNNVVFTLFSAFIVCVSLYFLIGNWGDVSRSFFLGLGIDFILFGVCMGQITTIGSMGMYYKFLKDTWWTGRRVLYTYMSLVAIGTVATVWFLYFTVRKVADFQEIYDELENGDTNIPFDALEVRISEKFNEFFFGITSVCGHLNTIWFWTFVARYCPADMSQEQCERCGDSWVTTCAVDQYACDSSFDVITGDVSQPERSMACPYVRCREGVLEYFIRRVGPVQWGLALLLLLFLVQMLMIAIILCTTSTPPAGATAGSNARRTSELEAQAAAAVASYAVNSHRQQSGQKNHSDRHNHNHEPQQQQRGSNSSAAKTPRGGVGAPTRKQQKGAAAPANVSYTAVTQPQSGSTLELALHAGSRSATRNSGNL